MKLLAFAMLVGGMIAGPMMAETINFDTAAIGSPPPGWTATKTGKGEPKWTVENDTSAPSQPHVLQQSGTATYALCLKHEPRLKDGFVEVKFKPVSGREDQAGGLVWRAQDAENYYVVRANAREDNVVLYKTEKGKRLALDIVGRAGGYGVQQAVVGGQWHTLRVEFRGSRFTVFFNGTRIFQVEDATFPGPGQVGVWTKADSVTRFDDFTYGAL